MYKKSKGFVEEAYDVEFDETNGSHEERENLDDVRNEGLSNGIKTITIGDIKPREENEEDDDPSISIRVNPPTSITNIQEEHNDQEVDDGIPHDYGQDDSHISPSTSTQEPIAQPRISHHIAKDHPIDQIV